MHPIIIRPVSSQNCHILEKSAMGGKLVKYRDLAYVTLL